MKLDASKSFTNCDCIELKLIGTKHYHLIYDIKAESEFVVIEHDITADNVKYKTIATGLGPGIYARVAFFAPPDDWLIPTFIKKVPNH